MSSCRKEVWRIICSEDFNAKLSDFGFAKAGGTGDKTHVSTQVMGTHGYAAPGYVATVTPRRQNIFVRGSLHLALESWNDHFLSVEGSRMQRELANIMLKMYRDDPWVLQRVSKHFYLEEVHDDSSADEPKI